MTTRLISRSKSPQRHRPIRLGVGAGAGVSALAVVLLMVAPAMAASSTLPAQRWNIEHFAGPTAPYGGVHVSKCAGQTTFGSASGTTGALSGWICDVTKVTGARGYARGVDALDGYTAVLTHISGTYTYAGLGNLSMPAGWASAKAVCTGGGNHSGAASVRIYTLYAVWFTDTVFGVAKSVSSDINYIWDSGTISCSSHGAVSTASPGMTGAFNTSNFVGGPSSYTFVYSHTYRFVIKIGCTGAASVGAFRAGTWARAWCDTSDSTTPVITLKSVVLY